MPIDLIIAIDTKLIIDFSFSQMIVFLFSFEHSISKLRKCSITYKGHRDGEGGDLNQYQVPLMNHDDVSG